MVDITFQYYGGALVLCLLIAVSAIPMPHRSVSMLDVGQGDSILIQDGMAQILIDGGPGATVLERLSEEMPFFDRRIEVVVVTHPHRDHIEGLLHVLDRYDVGMVLLPDYAYKSDIEKQFLGLMLQRRIPYRFAWYGQQLHAGSMHLRVMAPIPLESGEKFGGETPHDADVVARLDVESDGLMNGSPLSMILTGDAEAKVERQMLARIPREAFRATIVKVGHHGSITSTSQEFLDAISPSVSLISVGADNSYGHPRQEILDRLKNTAVFRTDRDGTISFDFAQSSWRIRCTHNVRLAFLRHVCINKYIHL